jgi:hypothetical protein|tara:strand:+ start:1071 stop:1433 length:363 start_codon:yes stop_codon:yes gene_type:complete
MKLKWKNVNPYSGIEEDAPVNSVAGGGVDMPPDALYSKKKKKELQTREGTKIDGRTKSYKEHRSKLETARQKRELARKGSRFIENIKKKTQEMSYGPAIQGMTPRADLNEPRGGKKKKKK